MSIEQKDTLYKKELRISGFKQIGSIKQIDSRYNSNIYKPDIIFKSNNGREIIVVEQSSNAMKKVHIAELTQFLTLAAKNRGCFLFHFLLILTQKKENVPEEYLLNEKIRLNFYLEELFQDLVLNKSNKIGGIYIIEDVEGFLLEEELNRNYYKKYEDKFAILKKSDNIS